MAYQNNSMAQQPTGFMAIVNDSGFRARVKACMGKRSGQFLSSMIDLYNSDGYLQQCDPNAVAMECLKAASLNLPIVKGLGYTYVVPYRNHGKMTPTFIIGYKGLLQLAQRTGQYKCINTDCIYEGEVVTKERKSGKLTFSGTPTSNKAIGYFAYVELVNGFEKMFYMTKEEVQAYGQKYSKAYNNGPWKTEFDKMAQKTVLRQILKYGPASTEMETYEKMELRQDEAATRDAIQQNANQKAIDVPPLEVDESTGEVIGPEDDTASNPGPDMEPVQAGIPGMGGMPDPGF